MSDAPDEWIVSYGMGGYVCSVCGDPVESEPCPLHQPEAHARCMDADRPIRATNNEGDDHERD
ncbi:hypothetical protein J2Y69_003092 [Microbacterium resistens]|uniref:Small CPxCG-related zinc finger protein n=1 Tax=Microbacterium resistens TaxID=156977 RepID=A0ABU1SFT3_9MICO|nr:hypothetical protein [Microbacterium resistens]